MDVRRVLEQLEAMARLVLFVRAFSIADRVIREHRDDLTRWEDDGGAIR